MEVFTIFWKNIKAKKGIFISILLLSTLLFSAYLTLLAVKNDYHKGFNDLCNEVKTEDVLYYTYSTYYDSNLKNEILKVDGVESVRVIEALTSVNQNRKIEHNGVLAENKDRNTYLFESFNDAKDYIKVYNSSLTGYLDDVEELKSGEIYLPIGLKNKIKCNVGDYLVDDFGVEKITDASGNVKYAGQTWKFKIKGFIAYPTMGSGTMGWKEVVISNKDFNALLDISLTGTEVIKTNKTSTVENFSLVDYVYKIKGEKGISPSTLASRIDAKTDISDKCVGSMTRTQFQKYSLIYVDIIGGILIAFSAILLIVVLIVISNSISGEIDTDYKKLGVMKSLGFSNFKIGLIISLLYLTAEVIGLILGINIEVFLKDILEEIFITNVCVMPSHSLNIINVLTVSFVTFGFTILIIVLRLLRLKKITPVKAINGNSSDVYFKPLIDTPITKKGLGLSISLKQVFAKPLRYLSIVIVTAFLSTFMLTSLKAVRLIDSDNTSIMFGYDDSNIDVSTYSETPITKELLSNIKDITEEYSDINYMISYTDEYVTLVSDDLSGNILCNIHLNPEDILGLYKGRLPKYDNEFITTELVCDMYDLKIGDKVTLGSSTGRSEFVLTGIYQCINDAGTNISITYDGAKKINSDVKIHYLALDIKNSSKINDVVNKLNEKYPSILKAKDGNKGNDGMDEYSTIVKLVTIIIMVFSIIFVLIAIRLMTVKAFNLERIDLGIYKAIGFDTFKLRNSLALRYSIASIFGTILGTIIALLFSSKLLSLALTDMGVSKVDMSLGVFNIILVIVGFIIVSYIGSFISSRRIKRISVKELVTE